MAERPTEQTYASDLKEWINQIIKEDGLPFSYAKVEIIKDRKRTDILVYDQKKSCILIIEVKRPEEGPSDSKVVKQAFDYARGYRDRGLRYFATHNVNFIVFWDAITGKKVDQFSITYVKELEDYQRKKDDIKESFREVLRWYVRFLEGEPPKPIDEGIIEILHGFIQGIVSATTIVNAQVESYIRNSKYRRRFEEWLRDKGWEDPKGDKQKLEEYCTILAKQFLYIYINKVLFYNVLRERQPRELPGMTLPKDLSSKNIFTFLDTYFQLAIRASKDYETVFQTNFIDRLPIPSDAITEIVKVTDYLNTLEYSNIGYDIIGKVFEKLIPEDERHTLGQYFTRSDVVDMILSFCIRKSNSTILDPACGSGTFLVRSYYRLRYLNGTKEHPELLKQLWGVDIDKFPAHLATINLAIRNLSEGENYPNVIYRDFFEIPGPKTSIRIGMQPTLVSWFGEETKPEVAVTGLDAKVFKREIPLMDCVVGNPPYTRQEEMGAEIFGEKYKEKLRRVVKSDFPDTEIPLRSGIYTYFFPHGAKFLNKGSRLGFVCLRAWLDTGYGMALKKFFLSKFRIVTIIESKSERWFPDAQMLPCVVVLEVCNSPNERDSNYVKFVQLKTRLSEFIPTIYDERDMVQEIHRWKKTDEFTALVENADKNLVSKKLNFLGKEIGLYEDEKLRVVTVKQADLKQDPKWGKFLGAPSIFFRMLEQASGILVPLHPNVSTVVRGITTGANEFFTFPNKFFRARMDASHLILTNKATKKEDYRIEKRYLASVVIKIKKHRTIQLRQPDGWILYTNDSKNQLKKQKAKLLNYLEYGEKKDIVLKKGKKKGERITGYQNVPTIRGTRAIWYNVGKRKVPPIIFPGIAWARHIVFSNSELQALCTDALVEVHPRRVEDAKVVCAILNSTFTAFLAEYSGRYIENRDRTISNQLKVSDIKSLATIDPQRLSGRIRSRLTKALERLQKREIDLRALYEQQEMAAKKELDKIILCEVLGLSEEEMQEARESLGEIVQARIERMQRAIAQGVPITKKSV